MAAKMQGAELSVVKLAEAKKGFALLPKRWVVERAEIVRLQGERA